jgi:hypothetical protein
MGGAEHRVYLWKSERPAESSNALIAIAIKGAAVFNLSPLKPTVDQPRNPEHQLHRWALQTGFGVAATDQTGSQGFQKEKGGRESPQRRRRQ